METRPKNPHRSNPRPATHPMLYSALFLPTRQEKKPPHSTFSATKTVQSILRHKKVSKNPIMIRRDAIALTRFRALGGPTQERPNRSSFVRVRHCWRTVFTGTSNNLDCGTMRTSVVVRGLPNAANKASPAFALRSWRFRGLRKTGGHSRAARHGPSGALLASQGARLRRRLFATARPAAVRPR